MSLSGRRQAASEQGDITSKRQAQAAQDREGNVPLPTFDRPVIGPIHVSHQGKLFLRQANVLALRPDPLPQLVKDCPLVHRPG